jgi:alkyl sulfatase BDS1-like metallo-beta-lactamase superfamily hydrolase
MGPDSLVLALKATFDPAKAEGLHGTYQLELGETPFRIEVSAGRIEAARGEAGRPDAVIRSDPDAITAVAFRGRSLSKAMEEGEIEVEGSRKAVRSLFGALT